MGKDNYNSKSVICIDLGLYFDSVSDAGRQLQENRGVIASACRKNILLAHGHYFIYAKDFNVNNIREMLMKKVRIMDVPVVCVETGQIFNNKAEVQHLTGIPKDSVHCCLKESWRTAGGYHWRKATDEEYTEFRFKYAEEIIQKLLNNKELMNKIQEYNKNNKVEI